MQAAFVTRMADVLAGYEWPHDPPFPVGCVAVRPGVLPGQSIEPLAPMPAQPAVGDHAATAGRPRRESSPYVRQGTAYLLMPFEPGTGQRWVEVPARRPGTDYGCRRRRLAAHYPQAAKIGLVRDTLPTPTAAFTSTCARLQKGGAVKWSGHQPGFGRPWQTVNDGTCPTLLEALLWGHDPSC